jgi:hypothetical protein
LPTSLAFSSRKWLQFVSPKRRPTSAGPHSIPSHKILFFSVTIYRTYEASHGKE